MQASLCRLSAGIYRAIYLFSERAIDGSAIARRQIWEGQAHGSRVSTRVTSHALKRPSSVTSLARRTIFVVNAITKGFNREKRRKQFRCRRGRGESAQVLEPDMSK